MIEAAQGSDIDTVSGRHHHHRGREAGRRRCSGPGGGCARRRRRNRATSERGGHRASTIARRAASRAAASSAPPAAVVGTTAATAAMPAAALAVEQGVIGDWAADGSKNVAVPDSAATNASGVGRHVPRAQRRGVPGKRRHSHRPAFGPRDVGLRMRRVRGGRGRRRAERGRACGRAGRRRHLRGGAWVCTAATRSRPACAASWAGIPKPGTRSASPSPSYPFDAASADRLGHGRVPLRGRPEAHLQDRRAKAANAWTGWPTAACVGAWARCRCTWRRRTPRSTITC